MSDGGGPGKAPSATDNHPEDTAFSSRKEEPAKSAWFDQDLDVGPSFKVPRLDPALRRVIELGRNVDAAVAERKRVAALLGEVGRSAYALNRLDARALAALSTLAGAAGLSKVVMREALAAAIAGDADGGAA